MSMSRQVRLGFCMVVCSLLVSGADAVPHAGYVYPASGQQGQSVRLLVGGSGLGNMQNGFFTGEGLKVARIQVVPGMPPPTGPQRKWLLGQLEGTNAVPLPSEKEREDWRKCEWWNRLDTLDSFQRNLVLRDLLRVRNALQMAPSIQQLLIVDIAIAPQAKPGLREFRVWSPNQGISEPMKFLVTASPHTPEPFYIAASRPQPPPPARGVPVVFDGQILPGETDSFKVTLEKGKTYHFVAYGRKLLPFIGDAVPGFFQPILQLMGPAGDEVAYADDWYFNPDPILYYTAAESGDYTLNIRDNLFRGREDFVYIVTVDEKQPGAMAFADPFPGLPQSAAGRDELHACEGAAPWSFCVTGALARADETGTFNFCGKAGEAIAIETVARQIGSPLDGVLRLYDESGRKIAEAYGQPDQIFIGECVQYVDPYLSVTLPATGKYRAVLEDRTKKFGEDYRFWMKVSPPAASFKVVSQHSAIHVAPGGYGSFKVYIDRCHGFTNDIAISSQQVHVLNPIIKTNATEWVLRVQLETNQLLRPEPVPVSFTAKLAEKGATHRVAVIPGEEMMQAFAYNHFVPVSSFYLMRLKGQPPKAKAKAAPNPTAQTPKKKTAIKK